MSYSQRNLSEIYHACLRMLCSWHISAYGAVSTMPFVHLCLPYYANSSLIHVFCLHLHISYLISACLTTIHTYAIFAFSCLYLPLPALPAYYFRPHHCLLAACPLVPFLHAAAPGNFCLATNFYALFSGWLLPVCFLLAWCQRQKPLHGRKAGSGGVARPYRCRRALLGVGGRAGRISCGVAHPACCAHERAALLATFFAEGFGQADVGVRSSWMSRAWRSRDANGRFDWKNGRTGVGRRRARDIPA